MQPWMRILFGGAAAVVTAGMGIAIFVDNPQSTPNLDEISSQINVETNQETGVAQTVQGEITEQFDVAELNIDISAADQVQLGDAIAFEASISNVDADLIREIDYIWSFGDNMTATGSQINHRYEQPGTFTATLTVEIVDANRIFHRHVERKTVEVSLPVLPEVTADFRMTPNGQLVSQSDVIFDAGLSSLSSPLSSSLTPNWEYTWEVENSAGIKEIRLQGEKVHYEFSLPQTYQVTLTATLTDQFGRSQVAQKKTSINVDNRAPIPVVFTEPRTAGNTVQSGEAVIFNASESIDPEKTNLTFEWDFNGDNIVDHIGTEPRVEWKQGFTQGTHTVIVRVRDSFMQARSHIPAIVHPIKVEVTGKPMITPTQVKQMNDPPVFVSGGLGLISNFQMANGAAGFRFGDSPFSAMVGAGINLNTLSIDQTHLFPQISKAFPQAQVMTEIDTAMLINAGLLYRVVDNVHLSFGGGLLSLEGEHKTNHPRVTISHQDEVRFHQTLPVASVGVAYQLSFALLSFQLNLVL